MFSKTRLISLKSSTAVRCGSKSAFASLALGFLAWAWPARPGFSFWPVLLFLGVMFFVYLSESSERRALRSSFWLLSVLGILGAGIASSFLGGFFLILAILAFGLVNFGILGLTNLLFRDRFFAYSLINTALFACFFIPAFYLTPGFSNGGVFEVILWSLAIFFGTVILVKETLVFNGLAQGRNLRIVAWSLAFITTEIALFSALLPLGFVDAAAFLTLFSILARDMILAHFKGFLSLSLVLRELTIFAVVLSLIFATVAWILP